MPSEISMAGPWWTGRDGWFPSVGGGTISAGCAQGSPSRSRLSTVSAWRRSSPTATACGSRSGGPASPGHRRGPGHRRDRARTGKSKPCVWRWQARFAAEGVAGLLRDQTRPPGMPPSWPASARNSGRLEIGTPGRCRRDPNTRRKSYSHFPRWPARRERPACAAEGRAALPIADGPSSSRRTRDGDQAWGSHHDPGAASAGPSVSIIARRHDATAALGLEERRKLPGEVLARHIAMSSLSPDGTRGSARCQTEASSVRWRRRSSRRAIGRSIAALISAARSRPRHGVPTTSPRAGDKGRASGRVCPGP